MEAWQKKTEITRAILTALIKTKMLMIWIQNRNSRCRITQRTKRYRSVRTWSQEVAMCLTSAALCSNFWTSFTRMWSRMPRKLRLVRKAWSITWSSRYRARWQRGSESRCRHSRSWSFAGRPLWLLRIVPVFYNSTRTCWRISTISLYLSLKWVGRRASGLSR